MESLKENLLHTWPGKGKLGRWIKKNFGRKGLVKTGRRKCGKGGCPAFD